MVSHLQVDVNGQETFSVSMKLLESYSGKLRKMLSKSAAVQTGNLKLIFHDFPGGAEGFELILRFCYNGGRINITPANILLLHSAAKFMEIEEHETNKYFENIPFWTWSELLDCLKQSQELLTFSNSSFVVQEILNAVVEKISVADNFSPFNFSSSDYFSAEFSGDLSTNYSSRCSSFQTTNWLQDLEFLNADLFEEVLSTMLLQKLDHGIICSFICRYQKTKFASLLSAGEKCKIIEVVINYLSSVDFPFRKLCDILQACSTLKMGKCWVKKVEKMIGFRLDEATLDDLMVPSHSRKSTCAYDVDLVLRLLKIFLRENRKNMFVQRLKKVGFLIDLYLAEVAPDPHLKTCKFLALVLALPDSARESCDRVYEIIDMYFKVHRFVSEEEKINICAVLRHDNISAESLAHLARNVDFPACVASRALVIRRSNVSKDDEEIIVYLSEGKEQKNSARISVTCPISGKSLPILCS